MKIQFTVAAFILFKCFTASVLAAEDLTPDQLEQWFRGELKSDEERALAVNEGDLVFLVKPPDKSVHYIQNTLVISKDSPATGWVNLFQCHDNLDAVASSQIVYRYKRMRSLKVDSFEKIKRAWIEDNSVQLEDVKAGAKLCIRADVGILYSSEDGSVVLKNGPFHRKFLDGYYPMHVSLKIQYPGDLLSYENISPVAQPGFGITQSINTVFVDAWFEGELRIEVKFTKVQKK